MACQTGSFATSRRTTGEKETRSLEVHAALRLTPPPPPSVHVFHRATNADYRGSGFDRGHLAAAANHKWSQKAMEDTFYLSNVAPQVSEDRQWGHNGQTTGLEGQMGGMDVSEDRRVGRMGGSEVRWTQWMKSTDYDCDFLSE